jgi:hypothetical protein
MKLTNKYKMNARKLKVPTRFEPETRFRVQPIPAAPFPAGQENGLEKLKSALLTQALEHVWDAELNSSIRRAANEAAAVAWVNPFPLLVLPVLFEEKVDAAVRHLERQAEIRQRSRALLAI